MFPNRPSLKFLRSRADSVFSLEWIQERRASASVLFSECLNLAARHPRGLDVGMEHGFAEGVQRAKGRYDILYGFNGNEEFMEVDETLRPVLTQILQSKQLLLFNGLLHSVPGSNEQLWHADGEHLFPGSGHSYLPVHSLNIFVPLVDITEDNGGTEFFLGSHRLTGESDSIVWQDAAHKDNIGCTGDPVAFTCRAGSVIMFDYRILHRGLANTSQTARPVLYFTYARAWFRDMHNFPARPLLRDPRLDLGPSPPRPARAWQEEAVPAAPAVRRGEQARGRDFHLRAGGEDAWHTPAGVVGWEGAPSARARERARHSQPSLRTRTLQFPSPVPAVYSCVPGIGAEESRGVGAASRRQARERARAGRGDECSLRTWRSAGPFWGRLAGAGAEAGRLRGTRASQGYMRRGAATAAAARAGPVDVAAAAAARPVGQLDVEAIRREFPAVQKLGVEGGVVLCDGAGGSQVPQTVIAAMQEQLTTRNFNVGAPFAGSSDNLRAWTGWREDVAALLNCQAQEVIFGNNATTLTFHMARAFASDPSLRLQSGDNIVVTTMDHACNVGPWELLARDTGAELRRIAFDRGCWSLDANSIDACIDERTKLVAVGAASNLLGSVNDFIRVVARARAVGAISYVDAVHLAPHAAVDVQAIGCDMLVCSPYKFFGPHAGASPGVGLRVVEM
jgi:hypothetical protein